ncbi:MAG: citrate lyase ACP [Spirochaetia bacterium]|nr:citrate lyase ACP [Spirochaetia bacterium]
MEASAGTGEKMDAWVTVYDTSINGDPLNSIEIEISSPVESLFGSAQQVTVLKMLDMLEVHRCLVKIEDAHAIDTVLAARVKAAVLRLRRAGGAV